jgi:hypothetical protein
MLGYAFDGFGGTSKALDGQQILRIIYYFVLPWAIGISLFYLWFLYRNGKDYPRGCGQRFKCRTHWDYRFACRDQGFCQDLEKHGST